MRLFGRPDLTDDPVFQLRLAGGIDRLIKARPATSSLSPTDFLKVGHESGYMAAIVDVLTLIRAEQEASR